MYQYQYQSMLLTGYGYARFEHPGKTWASVTHRKFSLQAVAVATVHATYRWVESEARRVLREREELNAREKERRQG